MSYESDTVRPSVLSQPKISELAHQFLLIFCIKLNSHKVRKVTKSDLAKKNLVRLERPVAQEWGFWGFDKNLITIFTWLWKYQWSSNFLGKPHVSKKMVYALSSSRPIRLWGFLNCNNPQISWVNFLCEVRGNRINRFKQSFQVCVVRHGWAYPKLCQIVSQLHLKNDCSFEVDFLHTVRDQ